MRDLLLTNLVVRVAALTAAVLLLVLLLLGFTLHRVGVDIRRNLGLLARREEISERFQQLLADLAETETARRELARIRPPSAELVGFVRGLEDTAATVFIEQRIQTLSGLLPMAQSGGYSAPVVRYRVTLLGPLEKFTAFLRELRRLPHLTRIENIQLRTAPESDLTIQGQYEITFVTAVQETGGPAASPLP